MDTAISLLQSAPVPTSAIMSHLVALLTHAGRHADAAAHVDSALDAAVAESGKAGGAAGSAQALMRSAARLKLRGGDVEGAAARYRRMLAGEVGPLAAADRIKVQALLVAAL